MYLITDGDFFWPRLGSGVPWPVSLPEETKYLNEIVAPGANFLCSTPISSEIHDCVQKNIPNKNILLKKILLVSFFLH